MAETFHTDFDRSSEASLGLSRRTHAPVRAAA